MERRQWSICRDARKDSEAGRDSRATAVVNDAIFEISQRCNETCRHFGISPQSFCRHYARINHHYCRIRSSCRDVRKNSETGKCDGTMVVNKAVSKISQSSQSRRASFGTLRKISVYAASRLSSSVVLSPLRTV
ncbi:uncharacterized protein LOC116848936 [Odontomachus brunneus]|uniref:uncharacterized protein LOC116848936 n=1 Tax=Odontomachus brunneus TaxID=486640 RepID=UPI0013F28A28|nr:uncharacterized protein LOC116848936 [Odontomachus brunneus]